MNRDQAIDAGAGGEQPAAMVKSPPEPVPPPRAVDRARAAREARQAAALRANLRRRKAQARGREAAGTAGPDDETPEDAGQG